MRRDLKLSVATAVTVLATWAATWLLGLVVEGEGLLAILVLAALAAVFVLWGVRGDTWRDGAVRAGLGLGTPYLLAFSFITAGEPVVAGTWWKVPGGVVIGLAWLLWVALLLAGLGALLTGSGQLVRWRRMRFPQPA